MKRVLFFSALLLFPVLASVNQASLKTLKKSIQRNQTDQDLKLKFVGVATGIDLSALEEKKGDQKQDLLDELKNLATPLLQSIKRISERPRRIEELKERITFHEKLLLDIENAQEKISIFLIQKEYKIYRGELRSSNKILSTRYDEMLLDLDLAKSELLKLIGQKSSLFDMAGAFLKSKGKNLMIALMGFLLVIVLLSFVKKKIFRISIFYGRFDFLRKPLSAFYSLLTSLFAIVVAIFCLHALDDWLLVTIVIFILIGISWSLKNYIPQFFEEIKLILNLGAVREGEKIFYDGIPWRVDKLSFYSRLSNDCLQGGSIRVAAKKLLGNYSRRIAIDEKWFPTQKGDWILIDHSILGQISNQTPDQIVIDRMGGGYLHIRCSDYISMKIENLSSGYSISESFGLDYSLQKDLSHGLLDYFIEGFEASLKSLEGVEQVGVEFGDCGADSLNVFVRVDCAGFAAPKFFGYQRVMQKTFLDLCNQKGFDIPFKQLTVHMNNNG